MNYIDAISEMIDWLEEHAGFTCGHALDGAFVEPVREGEKLVWRRLDETPGNTFVHADCVAGREVSPDSFREYVRLALEAVDDE